MLCEAPTCHTLVNCVQWFSVPGITIKWCFFLFVMFTSLAIGFFTSQQKVAFVESFSHWSSGSLGVKTNWFTTTPHTWLSRILTLFKYFAQGFKLSPSIPLTSTFTVKNNFRDLVYIFASKRKNWNIPLMFHWFALCSDQLISQVLRFYPRGTNFWTHWRPIWTSMKPQWQYSLFVIFRFRDPMLPY